jgi:ribosome-binding factor A
MSKIRQEKFARLIQKEMGYIFLTTGKRYFQNAMVSVTRVIASPDLGFAKIYVNFINSSEPDKMMKLILEHTRELRRELAQRIGKDVRKVPEIAFFYDDTLDYYEKMETVFKKIKKQDEGNEKKPEN